MCRSSDQPCDWQGLETLNQYGGRRLAAAPIHRVRRWPKAKSSLKGEAGDKAGPQVAQRQRGKCVPSRRDGRRRLHSRREETI